MTRAARAAAVVAAVLLAAAPTVLATPAALADQPGQSYWQPPPVDMHALTELPAENQIGRAHV